MAGPQCGIVRPSLNSRQPLFEQVTDRMPRYYVQLLDAVGALRRVRKNTGRLASAQRARVSPAEAHRRGARWRPACRPRSTFRERPLVLMPTTTSPGGPGPAPGGGTPARRSRSLATHGQDRGVGGQRDRRPGLRCRSRSGRAGRLATCWASAALPPLPNSSIFLRARTARRSMLRCRPGWEWISPAAAGGRGYFHAMRLDRAAACASQASRSSCIAGGNCTGLRPTHQQLHRLRHRAVPRRARRTVAGRSCLPPGRRRQGPGPSPAISSAGASRSLSPT